MEYIKKGIKNALFSQVEICKLTGMDPGTFSRKLKNNSFRPNEVLTLAEAVHEIALSKRKELAKAIRKSSQIIDSKKITVKL